MKKTLAPITMSRQKRSENNWPEKGITGRNFSLRTKIRHCIGRDTGMPTSDGLITRVSML